MKRLIKSITTELIMNCIYDLNCKRKLSKGTPIVIYQMGKVGSKSIETSLKKAGLKSVFHTHMLRHDHKLSTIRRFYDYIRCDDNKVKIISLTREPFSRNISSFFETIERYISSKRNLEDYAVDELISIYFRKFPYLEVLSWFDCELRRVTGINVYDYSLVNQSYIRISQENTDLLVLKREIGDSYKEKLIDEFLGIKDFKVISVNKSEDKPYKKKYTQFKIAIKYEDKYVNEIIDSKYFRFFYGNDKDEIMKSISIA